MDFLLINNKLAQIKTLSVNLTEHMRLHSEEEQ